VSKEDPILIEKNKIDFKQKGSQRKARAYEALKGFDQDIAMQVFYKKTPPTEKGKHSSDFSQKKKLREKSQSPRLTACLKIQSLWRGYI
jgi:hypothetical protein